VVAAAVGAKGCAVIRLDAVSVRRSGADLVRAVDLEVAAGEFVAVIGPNGAGKSTLLRVASGELTPSSGSVHLGEHPMDTMVPGERARYRAAFLQGAAADVPFSAYDVVMMGRHPHRRAAGNSAAVDVAAVTAAMELTDVAHLAPRRFATLSAGEQTRVALARVLAQETPLLLVDEPTTSLDVGHDVMVMGALADLARSGRAVLAVLHDLNAAARHATRIVAMEGGEVVAAGLPGDVLRPDLLSRIYRHPMRVVPHPFEPGLLVLAVGQSSAGADGTAS
jgi:iron complex transport system ATP-binding protein